MDAALFYNMYFSCIDQSGSNTGPVSFIHHSMTPIIVYLKLSKWIASNYVHLSLPQSVCHRNYEPGCVLISKLGVASQLQVPCSNSMQQMVMNKTASDGCYSSLSPHGGNQWSYFAFVTASIHTHSTKTHTDLSSHVLSVISNHPPLRWVLCANHTEPVKGFLGRFLRRKLIETEIDKNMRSNDLIKIIDWIPKTWQHLNSFLEAHSSSDVTIGNKHNTQAN